MPGNLLGIPAFVKQFGAISPSTGVYVIKASYLTTWASCFAAFQVIGQLVGGWTSDRWGRKPTFFIMTFWIYIVSIPY